MNYELFTHSTSSWLDTRHSSLTKKNIFLVNMTKELEHHFSELAQKWLDKYLLKSSDWNHQTSSVAIIVNKKWYSNGLICHKCGHVPQCKKCSVSISYHKIASGETIGLCHICKSQYNLPASCPECHSHDIKEFGIWTQKVAEYIQKEYNLPSMIIESETANSQKKIENLSSIISHLSSAKVFIGTSILTTPPKGIKFDLVIFLNADLGLNIPDYTAAEKNFYFLYDAFTKYDCQNFIVQSFNPDQYSIRSACKLDKSWFYAQDNVFREENHYPPFSDLCVILYKNEIEERMFTKVDTLYKELLYLKDKYDMPGLEIYSTPPLIYKMFGKYRYNIILKWKDLRNFMDIAYTKLKMASKGFKIDREAESIV